MTVSSAFTELEQEFRQLERVAGNVNWAVVQVRPASTDGQSIADYYESATIDFGALAKAARQAADDGRRATTAQADLFTLRRALVDCQEYANQLVQRYYGDIASCERLANLNDLARRGSRDWATWVIGVRDGLSSCPQILHSISQSLLHCWQEITEPIGPMSVTAQATSLGSRIVIRGSPEINESPAEYDGDTSINTTLSR
ncbi:MAG TPA: hypothetical protein VFV93_09495 [Thermomicrobiales bacterium]|nr:hypothetical protein [Thermomicrobiales bacterium]